MRVVLDTNVILSGLFWGGNPSKLLRKVEQGQLKLCMTLRTFLELKRTLQYPQIRKKINANEVTTGEILQYIGKHALIVEDAERADVIQEDPSDNMFLDCAEQAGARWIVSGDRHLLQVGSYRNIRIVKPTTLLSLL